MAGPPKLYPERVLITFPEGVKAQIVTVLDADETVVGFLRTAVDTELHRRERTMKRKKEDGADV